MRSITTFVALLAATFLTGCTLFESSTNTVSDNIENSKKNLTPPQAITNIIQYEITNNETINIYPEEIAKDLDGDDVTFAPKGERILQNNYLKITINEKSIECTITNDIEANVTESFEIYITDGTYRTEITIDLLMVEKKQH